MAGDGTEPATLRVWTSSWSQGGPPSLGFPSKGGLSSAVSATTANNKKIPALLKHPIQHPIVLQANPKEALWPFFSGQDLSVLIL